MQGETPLPAAHQQKRNLEATLPDITAFVEKHGGCRASSTLSS
jgi:hypothetical protein